MFEHAILILLQSIIPKVISEIIGTGRLSKRLDFYVDDSKGKLTGIEVKGRNLSRQVFQSLRDTVGAEAKKLDRFLLVTPEPPDSRDNSAFIKLFSPLDLEADWISGNDLLKRLGIGETTDLQSPSVLAALQVQAVTEGVKLYSTEHDGVPKLALGTKSQTTEHDESAQDATDFDIRLEQDLARQFPYGLIRKILEDGRNADVKLKFGEAVPNPIVLLSDIKAFSTLVRVARPAEMREIMSGYYFRTRDAVFRHGGVLDKFIGDAVLAIWGYPYSDSSSASRAMHCAAEIFQIGRWLVDEFSERHDELIESGTRIGIATGELWALDIGNVHTEVTFIGNVINLAARLEGNCEVNGVLIANRVKRTLDEESRLDMVKLGPKRRDLEPKEVKGQGIKIRAWQFTDMSIKTLLPVEARKMKVG